MSTAADDRACFRGRVATTSRTCIAIALLALAGCATTPPGGAPDVSPPYPAATPGVPPLPPGSQPPPTPRNVEPPAPKMNLSGFPLPYRQGYADGCASATGPERKDASRFSVDMNYRTGWTDGLGLCKKK